MTRSRHNPDVSRRTFLRKAVAGAGATAAALATQPADAAQGATPIASAPPVNAAVIRVPAEFAAAAAADPVSFDFPMTGAQVFARACKEEGVAALFACPGN
jgi:hypothetical protein